MIPLSRMPAMWTKALMVTVIYRPQCMMGFEPKSIILTLLVRVNPSCRRLQILKTEATISKVFTG